jgi:hypothetical protein
MTMTPISHRAGLLLLGLTIPTLLAAAPKTIVIPQSDEVYRATFDDAKISETRLREWLLLSPYVVVTNPRNGFGMAGSREHAAGGDKMDKTFFATPLEFCGVAGCDHDRRVDEHWLANAAHNLELGRSQVVRLERMAIPQTLEPIRAYLLSGLRYTLDLQRRRLEYIKSGEVQPLRERVAAVCASALPDDEQLFAQLAAAELGARPEASNKWYSRMWRCSPGRNQYPMAEWRAFLKEYGVRENVVYQDPE